MLKNKEYVISKYIFYHVKRAVYLFQGLLPAVALFTEGALVLFGVGIGWVSVLPPVDVFGAHLFLKVLLQAGLVCKLSEAVGALEWSIMASVGCLHVVIQEPFLCEVFAAIDTDEGPLSSVNPIE